MVSPLNLSEVERLGFNRQAWMIPALRPLILSMHDVKQLKFVHHHTTYTDRSQQSGTPAHGSTVWIASTLDQKCAAIAFDWTEVERLVVCVTDILAITSNVFAMDESGAAIDDGGRLLLLATVVHELNWQVVVVEQLPQWTSRPSGGDSATGAHKQ